MVKTTLTKTKEQNPAISIGVLMINNESEFVVLTTGSVETVDGQNIFPGIVVHCLKNDHFMVGYYDEWRIEKFSPLCSGDKVELVQ